ncbi:MAG: MFS transporter [Deltaproteobacteria bacterium]
MPPSRDLATARAWKFIILLGIISLLSDITYEGARSITGPFLGELQASALVVGVVAGLGEFLGYALRLGSGYLADRTGKYWPLTIWGYALNLLSVPLLALVGSWPPAAGLIVSERLGKGLRTPARDAMLSHATTAVGRGWGFGFHNAMDQTGAVAGPLLVAGVLALHEGYWLGFAILLGPAILALLVLAWAARLYPHPRHLEMGPSLPTPQGLSRPFWLYAAGAAVLAAGYADFPLIAYHFHQEALFPPDQIPLLYALAMGVDALGALALGRLFDRLGLVLLIAAPLISAGFAPLVFLGGRDAAWGGMVLWGLGMGVQGSIMRAALAGMVSPQRRASAYGLFHTIFGLSWFLGSALMGLLYGISLTALVIFSMAAQLLALPFFLTLAKTAVRAP